MTDRTRIRRRRWTFEEDMALKALYPSLPANEVAARLDRTVDSIWIRARQLGLDKREEVIPWSDDELAELRRSYPIEAPKEIAARLGRSASAIYQQARCMGLVGRKAAIIKATVHDYFGSVTTSEQAYILGLLAADGNVSDEHPRVVFGLQEKDIHLVEFVRDQLNPKANISVSAREGRRFGVIQITSRQMVDDLACYGIVPRKSRSLAWPAFLGSLQRPFLSGYFDGDGWVHTITRASGQFPGWGVCSGSEQFLLDMKEYIRETTGVTLGKVAHRKQSSLYQISTSGLKAYLVNEWLHEEGLGLQRKRYAKRLTARYAY